MVAQLGELFKIGLVGFDRVVQAFDHGRREAVRLDLDAPARLGRDQPKIARQFHLLAQAGCTNAQLIADRADGRYGAARRLLFFDQVIDEIFLLIGEKRSFIHINIINQINNIMQ